MVSPSFHGPAWVPAGGWGPRIQAEAVRPPKVRAVELAVCHRRRVGRRPQGSGELELGACLWTGAAGSSPLAGAVGPDGCDSWCPIGTAFSGVFVTWSQGRNFWDLGETNLGNGHRGEDVGKSSVEFRCCRVYGIGLEYKFSSRQPWGAWLETHGGGGPTLRSFR